MFQSQDRFALALSVLLAIGGSVACGEDSREARLRAANEAVEAAEEELAEARARLEEREQELEEVRALHAEAREAVRQAESRVAEAKAAVGLQATDQVLFRAVQKQLLEDEGLAEVAIAASVEEGVVTLRGDAPDAEVRDRAVAVAEGVPGVLGVKSQIRVEELEPQG